MGYLKLKVLYGCIAILVTGCGGEWVMGRGALPGPQNPKPLLEARTLCAGYPENQAAFNQCMHDHGWLYAPRTLVP